MIKLTETQEDNIYYFFLNFDEYMNSNHESLLSEFWDENKKFFDETLVENNYVMYKMTNLINPNAIHNVRRILLKLKLELEKKGFKEEIPLYNLEYNEKEDVYTLVSYPIYCPVGFREDGDKCVLDEGKVINFPQCKIGYRWSKELSTCLPEKLDNCPEGYVWDIESYSCFSITSYSKVKLRDIIKENEIDYLRNNPMLWDIIIGEEKIIINAHDEKEIIETNIYAFFKGIWDKYKEKLFLEIGKSLRDNFSSYLKDSYYQNESLVIELNNKSDELNTELKNQIQYYWDKLINELELADSVYDIHDKKKDKVYIKLKNGNVILVSQDLIEFIK